MSIAHASTTPEPPVPLWRRLLTRWGRNQAERWCPVCARGARRFGAAGAVPRADAKCPHCGALERHRLVWLYLTQRTDLFDGRARKVLHIAPERAFAPRFAQRLGEG